DRRDNISLHRMLLGQKASEALAALVHRASEDHAVRPRKINMFEDAILMRLLRRETNGFQAAARNARHFSRLHFAHVFGVDQIESARFRSSHPGSVKASETKRTKPARIANRVNFVAR